MQPDLTATFPFNHHSAINAYYQYTTELPHLTELLERKSTHEGPNPETIYEVFSPDGIHFWHCNTLLQTPKTITVENQEPFFNLVFVIKNRTVYREAAHENATLILGNYEYNLLYFPPKITLVEWQPLSKLETFSLNLSVHFLEKYLPGDHPVAKKMMAAKKGRKFVKASEQNLPLTPHITGILLDILNCPLEKMYKRMFLKAKVIELLSVMLSQMDEFKQLKHQTGLRKEDVNKMQEARERLHQNLQSPCSLIDLAHQVGTNENYLKKHFKQLYGNTVYGYIQELRMQQAKNMLKENIALPEIAQAIGYKNVNHFTAAFKKYFGYSPQALKQ